MRNFILAACLLILSSGCTHLSSVSTSSIPKNRGKKVQSTAERFIFFAFNFNNDYVDEMTEDLANQCPKGKVKGILSKHESITYFPLVAHKIRVSAEGYCVR